jgi:hypothetical protein
MNFEDETSTEDHGLPYICIHFMVEKHKKLRGLGPRADYTDQAIAACRRH